MASATLTILGLFNWQKDHDEDLFSELMIPEDMNKDVLVNNILMEAAPFEVYYPDPDIMEQAIGFWSKANIDKWNKWADSWEKASEFNQLENFDRTEHEEITHSGQDDVSNTQTRNLTGSDNRTVNLTDEHKVSAYDSGSYAPKDQDLHTGTDNHALTDGGTQARRSTATRSRGTPGIMVISASRLSRIFLKAITKPRRTGICTRGSRRNLSKNSVF